MIRTGLDDLLDRPERLAGRRYGLLAHAASVSRDLRPAHLALAAAGQTPALLFGPEHGFFGIEQDMVACRDAKDPWTGLPVVSLYGKTASSLRPPAARFADLDLLVIDLQDIGSRYYTYVATAVWAAKAALAAGCEVWILDRPNPLGGVVVEGNLRRQGFDSFVGAFELPVRHGLTLGELVLLEAERGAWGEGVQVWRIGGWHRGMAWEELGRPWVAPSPNVPTVDTALVYPGTCLVEATELSEGRGTTRPFRLIGGPRVDPLSLSGRLARLQLDGVAFLPTYFRPSFHKHCGERCGGVEIVITDRRRFRPYRCGVELLRAVHDTAPAAFAWRTSPYEFVTDRPAIDLLAGDDSLRLAIDQGSGLDDWIAGWSVDEDRFRRDRRAILLYAEEGGR